MLTAEEKKQEHYSKDRLKVIRPSQTSPEGRLKFKPSVAVNLEIQAQEAMSELVNASQQWKFLTKDLSTFDRCNLGRDILRKKPS